MTDRIEVGKPVRYKSGHTLGVNKVTAIGEDYLLVRTSEYETEQVIRIDSVEPAPFAPEPFVIYQDVDGEQRMFINPSKGRGDNEYLYRWPGGSWISESTSEDGSFLERWERIGPVSENLTYNRNEDF